MQKYLKRLDKNYKYYNQNCDDIVSKHSSDIRFNHLEEMTIDTDLSLHPIMSKPYPLPLKHYKFVIE